MEGSAQQRQLLRAHALPEWGGRFGAAAGLRLRETRWAS
jgi:hypothetical protein